MRIALGIEYDGTHFAGWQSQAGVRTAQGSVEDALSRVAAHRVAVTCAGRTDAGVHAQGQVVHFDTSARRALRGWLLGANANLPEDVSCQWAGIVPESFHARYSALARHYRYYVLVRMVRPALLRTRVCWQHRKLRPDRMQKAADLLIGEHDFSAFRALACQAKSPIRRIDRLEVGTYGDLICIDVVANAFLHHMVRNIVGVLLAIGRGEREPGWAHEVLQSRDRTQGGVTAPAGGLHLVRVVYPECFALPEPAGLSLADFGYCPSPIRQES